MVAAMRHRCNAKAPTLELRRNRKPYNYNNVFTCWYSHPFLATPNVIMDSYLSSWGPMLTILLIIVILMMLGALPRWPHSRNWGYYPSGGLGLILVIVIILLVLGY